MSFVTVGAIGAGVTAAGGLVQALSSGKKKKERELEAHAASMPQYQGSSALDKYYQQSQQQANTAATQSALYKQQQQQINRQMGMGLTGAMQGQGDVARIVQAGTDASMKSLAGAEQQKEARFAQLGNVAAQKSAEDMRKFQINQMQPFEAKYNLLAAKAARAAEQQQAGLQNIIGGAQQATTMAVGKMKA